MTLETLDDMFNHQLETMYYVENQLVEATDELARDTTNDDLSDAFAEHREETREHVNRLEQVFETRGRTPEQSESPAVDGLIQEKQAFDQQTDNDDLRNLFYLGAAMKSERLEITSYDSMLNVAHELELGSDVTDPLEANRDSEQNTLRKLKAEAEGSKFKSLLGKLL